ncbi:spore coat protein [Alicyclobacillus acidiphilus]|uniref:spore coat protein n=1 Tax=Alicyclobacillus acidiphilus TaxID=182455 RepID=UPI000A47E069|nr:spore coat protein [Alicyclobacillus acidiphilus]
MTDPGTNANPNMGKPLDIADFTDLIGFANASAALEFLITVKSGIRNAAMSLTECATPEVRAVVRNQLFQALDMHEKLSQLMIDKGWLHPYNPGEQIQMDAKSAQKTAEIAKLPLFKDRTKVLETFDTPQRPH